MTQSDMPKERLTIVHENFVSSLFSDLTTFSFLLGSFWINQEFFNSAIPSWVLGTVFFLYAFSSVSVAKKYKFTNKKQAQEFIDSFYKKETKNDTE